MPRLNRGAVLTLLAVSSCFFLLLQIHYYRKYVIKQPGFRFLNPSGHVTDSHAQWEVLRTFLGVARRFRLPLFLADAASLELLARGDGRGREASPCGFLCAGRPVTAFGLQASRWKYDSGFLAAARLRGFQAMEIRGRDPRLAGLASLSGEEIPLHFLFRLRGYVIQVVLLYQRSGGFLWHGALRLKADADRGFANFAALDYGRHAGAYDEPELIAVAVDDVDVRVPGNASDFLRQRRNARFLECRYGDASSFLQRYPDDSSAVAVGFRRKVKALLRSAAETLGALGVPFWLSSGTCLGWFRQCGVISYSRDVDIGVFAADFRPDMAAAFASAGLSLKHKFGKASDSLELSFLKDDVKLDVFFFYEEENAFWNGGTQARSGRKFKFVFPKFSLCWAELLELKVRVPCETLDYVAANYGDAWNVPVRSWDWKSSPSNVYENGAWPAAEWEELIQVY